MNRHSLRVRLSLWYFSVLALSLLLFGGGMWFAMSRSLYIAVDQSLRDRVQGVRRFIEQEGALSLEEMQAEFREHSVLGPGGDLFQVSDAGGNWLYRSGPLWNERVPVYRASTLAGGRVENIDIRGVSLRFLSERISTRDRLYAVQVAAPLDEINQGLDRFLWILLATIPAVLVLTTAGGYYLSSRALTPVAEIITASRTISMNNLSRRLPVPTTADELQRLSETLNEMFERLEAAVNQITRFTADASHELRTPVALMRTTAELALRRTRSHTDYREALAQILKELERTSELLENLLFLARVDSGRAQSRRDRIDLTASLRDACEQIRVLAVAKDVRFRANIPERPTHVVGDAAAIRRLFLVLLDNAIKYTHSGGTVEVALERRNGLATVEVRDTGIGISEADLPHVFERFYRADKARSRDQGGTGLGLAIALSIAEWHHGEIHVQSELGHGSTFRAQLPIKS